MKEQSCALGVHMVLSYLLGMHLDFNFVNQAITLSLQ